MNHAADDPLPPFTSQKAALLTTKSLQNHGMVDPSATDRLKGLLVDVSQIDAAPLGTEWAQVATLLPRSNFLCTNRKGHVEIKRPKV
jgi:hypothetical protein